MSRDVLEIGALFLLLAGSTPEVSSVKMWEEYRKDEKAADAKYRDKRVRVKGKIVWISATYTVYLEGGKGAVDGVTTVPADGHIVEMGGLKQWGWVTLECTGLGLVFNEPILNKCEVKP